MGIPGLLPLLKSVAVAAHIREFQGMRAGVDTYAWLHRGIYSCGKQLALGEGDDMGYIRFCLSMVDVLLQNNVIPVMVFDGNQIHAKSAIESNREESRRRNLEEGKRLMALGRESDAIACFSKAVDVTPEMAKRLIVALQQKGVQVLVAPYEADAQLAYLSITGQVNFVISEDSDLLAFGCRRVLYKFDRSGAGEMIELRKLTMSEELPLSNFTPEMFLDMCVLNGCDYLPGLEGLGMKKAHRIVQKFRTTKRILRGLRLELNQPVPPDYEERFMRARLTFRHQSVFCTEAKRIVPLRPLEESREFVREMLASSSSQSSGEDPFEGMDLSFLGKAHPDEVAVKIANGELNPCTLEVYPLISTVILRDVSPLPPPPRSSSSSSSSSSMKRVLSNSTTTTSAASGNKRPVLTVGGTRSVESYFTPLPSAANRHDGRDKGKENNGEGGRLSTATVNNNNNNKNPLPRYLMTRNPFVGSGVVTASKFFASPSPSHEENSSLKIEERVGNKEEEEEDVPPPSEIVRDPIVGSLPLALPRRTLSSFAYEDDDSGED